MQGKFTTVNLLLKRKFPKNPRVSQCAQGTEGGEFFCSSVFLQASHSGKMVRTKKDYNREEITESAAEQLGINSTSKGLDECNDSSISDSSDRSLGQHPCFCFQVSQFLQNCSFLLPHFFLFLIR